MISILSSPDCEANMARQLFYLVVNVVVTLHCCVAEAGSCPPGVVSSLPNNQRLRSQLCDENGLVPVPYNNYATQGAPSGYVSSPSEAYQPPQYVPQTYQQTPSASPTNNTVQESYFPQGAAASSVCATKFGYCTVLTHAKPTPGITCYCRTTEGSYIRYDRRRK